MASIWIFLTLAIFAESSAASKNRIVGGNPTTIEHYPSLVQVEFFSVWSGLWSQSCAANVLTKIYVLSAAHCFVGSPFNPDLRRIRAGTTFRNRGGLVRYVRQATNHPEYGQLGFDADISVIRLSEPLEYSAAVQQATIPVQGSVLADNVPVVHAGWGATSQGGPLSPILLDVVIYTVNNEFCRQRYLELPRPGIITPNMICAGLLGVGGRDACQGDSGGPLMYGSITVGIVSWGHGCANASFPGVSAAIAPYTNWILSQVIYN